MQRPMAQSEDLVKLEARYFVSNFLFNQAANSTLHICQMTETEVNLKGESHIESLI